MNAPTPPTPAPRPSHRGRRVALIVGAVVVGLYLLREPLLGGLLARVASARLGTALGGPVHIERIGGSWFGGVVVEGLAGERLAGGLITRVSCDRLRVDWRLLDLVRGHGLAAITRIGADNLALAIDPAAAEPSAEDAGPGFDLGQLPEPLPALDITARVTVATPAGAVRLGALRLISDGRSAQLALADAEVPVAGVLEPVALSVTRTRERLRIDGVEPIAGIVPRRIELSVGAGVISGDAELGLLGGTLTLSASPSAVSVASQGLDLSAAPLWLRTAIGPTAPTAGRLEVALTAERAAGWTARGRVIAEGVVSEGRTLERMHLVGGYDGESVQLESLQAEAVGLGLAGRDLRWRPGTRWPQAGRLELTSDDLRPLLELAVPAAPAPPDAVTLRAVLTAADGGVRSDGLELRAEGWRLTGGAALGASGEAQIGVELEIDALSALAWCLPMAPGTAGSGELRLGYAGPLTRRADGLPAGRATLTLSGADVVLARRTLGEVSLDATLADGRAIVDVASRGERGAFTAVATGWLDADDVALRLEAAAGEWRGMPWALAEAADLRVGPAGVRLSPTEVAVGDGRLALTADLGERWQANATLDRLPIATGAALLGLGGASGTLTGSLIIDGPAERPTGAIALDLTDGVIAGKPARLALAARQDEHGLTITAGDLAWADLIEGRVTGSWPALLGRGGPVATGGVPDLRLHLAVPDLARLLPNGRLAGGFTATASAEAAGGAPSARMTVIGRALRIRPIDPEEPEAPPLEAALDLTADAAGAQVRVLARDAETTVLAATIASPAPLQPRDLAAPEAWAARPLIGEIVLDRLTLSPLQPLAPVLLGLAGRISGTVALTGSIGHPHGDGTLTLADAEFKLRSDLPRFTAGRGTLGLAGRSLDIAIDGELGYEPVSCRGRAILDERGMPVLDLRLTGTNALLAQDRDLRLRATLDVGLTGAIDALSASGSVQITDALWSRRIDLIRASTPGVDDRLQFFAIRGGPFAAMRLDLRIAADRTLRLVNNLINADCSLDLRLGGTGAVPVPEGRLWTTAARLSLPFSSLAIDRAEVRFTSDNPFRPDLEASGRTRMQGYELTASARGPIDDVEVEVTATPPLPPEDAVLLLTTGTTRTGLAAGGERGALTRVGTYLGQELLRKAAGPGNPDEEGLLDRVTISIGEQISESGADTISAELILVPERRPPPRPRGGLRVGELVLAGERDRYDAHNLGVIYRLRFK